MKSVKSIIIDFSFPRYSQERTLLIIIIMFLFSLFPVLAQVSVHIDPDCAVDTKETDLLISGDWINNGEYTSLSSRLIFNGIEDQYLYQPTDQSLDFIKIDKITGALYLTDSLLLSDSLILARGKIITTEEALLLMLTTAGSVGGDSISFVDGPLAKAYAVSALPDSFKFPTGKHLDYRPVKVRFSDVQTDSLIITVEQFNQSAENLSTTHPGADKVSQVHYWHIDKTGPGTFTQAQTILSYDSTVSDDGVEIASELRIMQLDTTSICTWNEIGGSGKSDYKGTIRSSNFSDFLSGYFTFGDAAGGADISLPVLLSLFEISDNRGEVILSWTTASEVNNHVWQVQRKEHMESDSLINVLPGRTVKSEFEVIGELDGQGTKPTETVYVFKDNTVLSGKRYSYRLVDISYDGRQHIHSEKTIIIGLPNKFELFQNYPNPFNPMTNIQYDLPVNSDVQLNIYNILGQKVVTLVSEKQEAGYYKFLWDGKNTQGNRIASGMYILAIQATGVENGEKQDFYKVKKMVMVK